MPTPTFDPVFRAALGEVSRKLTAERVKLAAPDQKIFDDLIANLKILETATDPQIQKDTWNLVINALSANNTGATADTKIRHEVVVKATGDLQEDDNIRHWQFVNLMGAAYEAVMLLDERQKMAPASDDLKAFRDAREEYIAAKDDAVETIARDYFSVDELDNKYANAVSDERRYQEEVEQLEAQKEYREKSFQALMVAFQARTDENKLASEAYQRTIDERDAQINVAKRAREDYDSFVEAMRLKEKQLRERAAIGVTSVKERAESLENGYTSSKLDTCVRADREQIRSFINTVVKDRVQQRRARSASRTLQNDQPQIGSKNP